MKRCPECRRDYYDDTLLYCLDDGNALLEGPASGDEPATAILTVHENDPATATLQPSTLADRNTPGRPAEASAKRKSLVAVLATVAIVAAGFAVYRYALQGKTATEHFKNVNLSRVTAEGAVESATISPDGKYIAYTLEESGKRSLWTKHLGTESRIQIVAPVEAISMFASAFSPDGGYVYYTRQDDQYPKGALYSVPVLGGTSRKIVNDVSQPVAVSRDGKQIVFGRYKLTNTDDHIMLVNSDGTKERLLVTVREPEYLQGSAAAWSPDSKMIGIGFGALVSHAPGQSPVYKMNVAVIPIENPQFRTITTGNWAHVGSLAWLGDGSGLVFVAGEYRFGARQIWQCSYPSGETRRVTNDLNSYDFDSLSLTADDRSIIAVQKHPVSQIWVLPDGDSSRARPIAGRRNVQDGRQGLDWTPDGRLVFDSGTGSNSSIWIMKADGSEAKQLTEGNSDDFGPDVSPDGRHIIFGSIRKGFQVWRMDIDGGNHGQITHGAGTPTFSYSPDGRWIVFNPYLGGIFKMPADGGEPIEVVAEGPLVYPQVSPVGDLLAYMVSDKDTKHPTIVVIKLDGGEIVRTFHLPVSSGTGYFESLSYRGFHWAPQGDGIIYIDTKEGVSNLWRQPLAGGPAKQITDFKTDRIYTFAYASDGRTLALARGSDTPDTVLITDVR